MGRGASRSGGAAAPCPIMASIVCKVELGRGEGGREGGGKGQVVVEVNFRGLSPSFAKDRHPAQNFVSSPSLNSSSSTLSSSEKH